MDVEQLFKKMGQEAMSKRGRPHKGEGALSEKIEVRFTTEEKVRIKKAAGQFGVMTRVIRAAVLEYLDKLEGEEQRGLQESDDDI